MIDSIWSFIAGIIVGVLGVIIIESVCSNADAQIRHDYLKRSARNKAQTEQTTKEYAKQNELNRIIGLLVTNVTLHNTGSRPDSTYIRLSKVYVRQLQLTNAIRP